MLKTVLSPSSDDSQKLMVPLKRPPTVVVITPVVIGAVGVAAADVAFQPRLVALPARKHDDEGPRAAVSLGGYGGGAVRSPFRSTELPLPPPPKWVVAGRRFLVTDGVKPWPRLTSTGSDDMICVTSSGLTDGRLKLAVLDGTLVKSVVRVPVAKSGVEG